MWVLRITRLYRINNKTCGLLHHQDSLESPESTAKLGVNTLIKIIYNMHIHLVAKHDSMCCAGRHACHAAVLKQTAPVLVLVLVLVLILDFQFFEFFLKYFLSKILPTHRLAPQRQVLLPGCQVNTADNQIEEPSLVPTMLVSLSWWSPCRLV